MSSPTDKSIIIVEDQKPIARALRLNLEAADFLVRTATDGRAGLELIEEGGADLVILDLIMPELNGFEVLERLNDNDIPVFIFSNLRQEEDRQRARDLGVEGFLVKSEVDVSQVVERVQKFFA